MRIKLIVSAATMAFAASSMSVAAEEGPTSTILIKPEFKVLAGIPAETIDTAVLATVRGTHWVVLTPAGNEPILRGFPNGGFLSADGHIHTEGDFGSNIIPLAGGHH